MSIHLEHLSKRYGSQLVVNDVSLEVADGQFFVLLGPSGSGKSTVLRLIAGLIPAQAGTIRLHGRDVTNLTPQERGIGFVFQHYALFPHMTVAENIEFGLSVRRVPTTERRKRRDDLLGLVGLAGLGDRLPRQLSGGQQQRVALARALAPHPAVLLLDEPFGALDAKIRVELRHSLRAIQRELGITTIFVTHDQEEAFELGDMLGVMSAGRLLEVGPPDELYLRPQTEFAATFLGSANLFIGETTTSGVRLGPLDLGVSVEPVPPYQSRRVQVLVRPEDVTLTTTGAGPRGHALGEAVVREITFVGAQERLLLHLPLLPGVRSLAPAAPFGSDFLPIEATRTQDQVRALPLSIGDRVTASVSRFHALAHPGLSLLVATTERPADEVALGFTVNLAHQAQARLTVLGSGLSDDSLRTQLVPLQEHVGALPALEARAVPSHAQAALVHEAQRHPYDIVVISSEGEDHSARVEEVLRVGDHHLLIVPALAPPAEAALPSRVLICVSGAEPSKEDVLFAARLCRHLGAKATLLTALPSEEDADIERERATRFLDAGVHTLGSLGVTAQTLLRSGPLAETIEREMAQGGYGLLVLGAPLRSLRAAKIRPLLGHPLPYPVLIVRSPFAAAALERVAAGHSTLGSEESV